MLNLSAVNQKSYTPINHMNIRFSVKQNRKGQYKVIFESLRYLARCKKLDPKPTIKSGELIINSDEELENILIQLQEKITMVEIQFS